MNEIIKLFSRGFIRHILNENRDFSSIKGEERENNDLIVSKNARDIGLKDIRDNSNFKRKK